MSSSLYDTIRGIVQQEIRRLRFGELAVVQEQHPHAADSDKDNYSCTVVLRDSDIVLKRVPVATGHLGVTAIPDVGDLVFVQFLHGDINAPIIVGSLYNEEDRPPPNSDGQVILQLPKAAGEGEGVSLRASSVDESSITVNLGGTVVVRLQDDDPAVEINIGGGSGIIKVDQDGAVQISSSAAIKLKSDADIDIEAGGTLKLKGSVINLN